MGKKAVPKLIDITLMAIQSGHRPITAEVLQRLPLRIAGYEVELGLLVKLAKEGTLW